MLAPDPTDETMQLEMRVVRDVGRRKLAAPRDHLLRGIPDAEVYEGDPLGTVRPPEETKLLDGEKTKPSVGLCCFECWQGHGRQVASLV